MPESMSLKTLDPGMRRNDGKGIDQRLLTYLSLAICLTLEQINPIDARQAGAPRSFVNSVCLFILKLLIKLCRPRVHGNRNS